MKPFVFLRRTLIFCASACILLSGCTAGSSTDGTAAPQLDPAYTVETTLTYGDGQTAALMLTRLGSGSWEAEFSEPAALSGVCLRLDGNAVSASYKGLAFTVPKSALPAKAMLCMMTDVLDGLDAPEQLSCTLQPDGSRTVQGDSESGAYSLSFSPDGQLLAFEMPAQPLKAEFSGYTPVTPKQSETVQSSQTTAAETTLSASASASTGCTTTKNEGVSQ